jgi:hypothetical protein
MPMIVITTSNSISVKPLGMERNRLGAPLRRVNRVIVVSSPTKSSGSFDRSTIIGGVMTQ